MKCCICQKGRAQGVNLYRINAKGKPGIWACAEHLKQTDTPPVDPEVKEIVGILTRRAAQAGGEAVSEEYNPAWTHGEIGADEYALKIIREAIRDILGVTSRRPHSRDPNAGPAAVEMLREVERHAEKARDELDRCLQALIRAAKPEGE